MLTELQVDYIFNRLTAIYGNHFLSQWAGMDPKVVKSIWAKELSPYSGKKEKIQWAFDNLPERPVNVIQFKNLIKNAPVAEVACVVNSIPVNPEIAQIAFASLKRGDGIYFQWWERVLENPSASFFAIKAAKEAKSIKEINA